MEIQSADSWMISLMGTFPPVVGVNMDAIKPYFKMVDTMGLHCLIWSDLPKPNNVIVLRPQYLKTAFIWNVHHEVLEHDGLLTCE